METEIYTALFLAQLLLAKMLCTKVFQGVISEGQFQIAFILNVIVKPSFHFTYYVSWGHHFFANSCLWSTPCPYVQSDLLSSSMGYLICLICYVFLCKKLPLECIVLHVRFYSFFFPKFCSKSPTFIPYVIVKLSLNFTRNAI